MSVGVENSSTYYLLGEVDKHVNTKEKLARVDDQFLSRKSVLCVLICGSPAAFSPALPTAKVSSSATAASAASPPAPLVVKASSSAVATPAASSPTPPVANARGLPPHAPPLEPSRAEGGGISEREWHPTSDRGRRSERGGNAVGPRACF